MGEETAGELHAGLDLMRDAQRHLGHTLVVATGHGPGCGPVDLDSGGVTIMASDTGAVLPARPRVTDDPAADLPED